MSVGASLEGLGKRTLFSLTENRADTVKNEWTHISTCDLDVRIPFIFASKVFAVHFLKRNFQYIVQFLSGSYLRVLGGFIQSYTSNVLHINTEKEAVQHSHLGRSKMGWFLAY